MNKISTCIIFCALCFLVVIPGCYASGNFYYNVTNLSYDPTTEVCCNDKLFDIKSGTECCGNGVIDPLTHQCCDGVPQLLKHGFECCYKVLYNIATEKCCYDGFDNSYRVVESDGDKTVCCNGKLFDYDKQICCNGNVVDNKNYTRQCCGNKVINSENDICCYSDTQDEIVKKRNTPDDVCYGEVVFNPNKQLWCNDVVVENPDRNLECCGNDTFDTEDFLCCWDSNSQKIVSKAAPDHDACCGVTTFNSANGTCCGNESFDQSQNFLCCWNSNSAKIVPKSASDHDACCGETTYNSTNGICCQYGDEIKYHAIQEGKPIPYCCGLGLYYYEENENCCGDIVYDSKKQTCCQDVYKEKFAARVAEGVDASCCGINTYNPETEICCGSMVMLKNGANEIHNCCTYEYKY